MPALLSTGAPAPAAYIRRVYGGFEAAVDGSSERNLDAIAGVLIAHGTGRTFALALTQRARGPLADTGVQAAIGLRYDHSELHLEAAFTPQAELSALWSVAVGLERRISENWGAKARATVHRGRHDANAVLEMGGGWSGEWLDMDAAILRQVSGGESWGGKVGVALMLSDRERVALNWSNTREFESGANWTCHGFVPVIRLITPPWLRTRAG
jgi:hypothetical protein